MDINFELYKIFYHAGKHQSFSIAAEALFISQSAVSQAIRNLEEKMDVRLFYRKNRSVSLTKEGELLFKHIEQVYNYIKAAENKITEMQNLEAGEIRIGVSDTICRYFLIPILEKFIKLHPNIKIQVVNRTSSQILQILKNGGIEIGIATLPIDDRDLEISDFSKVEDIFVACYRFSELKERVIGLDELRGYPLLLLQKDSTTRHILDEFFKFNGLELEPEVELESVELLVEFSRIGLGIAHVLRESAHAAIEKGELFEVKTSKPLPQRKVGIATMKGVPLSKASGEFIKFIKDN